MTNMATIQIVALIGWLLLMLSAYASYRLDWKKTVRMALTWGCIFAGLTLMIGFFM